MNFLLNIGPYKLNANSIDWNLVGITLLKIILGFGALMFLFLLFLLFSAILIARSVKSGIQTKSLSFAIRKFLKGFFYIILLFSLLLLLTVSLPFLQKYPLYITIGGAVTLSLALAFVIIASMRLFFERILIKLHLFKSVSETLRNILLLIDSYKNKKN
jgi:hypothetical protein